MNLSPDKGSDLDGLCRPPQHDRRLELQRPRYVDPTNPVTTAPNYRAVRRLVPTAPSR